ncbi:MAG: family N-acetyltransferase [Rhizobacter sp.]|nr:family N-acetyltransferase [Rhizobacter sp.]
MPKITLYKDDLHREPVIELWRQALGYADGHRSPALAIDKKLAVDDRLFFVALEEDTVIGTIMAGYDGHRGWLYSLAVRSSHRRRGIGASLVSQAEQALSALGCFKVNLQLAEGNEAVAAFYETLGYAVEKRVSMGKHMAANRPGD